MHELRIAKDLSAIVLDTAHEKNLSKVTKVSISFGQLVQIVPDIFEFAFSETVKNTVAEGAELNIEIVAVKMKCINCGSDFQITENLVYPVIYAVQQIWKLFRGKNYLLKVLKGSRYGNKDYEEYP